MKNNNSWKKLLTVFVSFASVAAIGLSTISCGSSSGLNAEDGHWVSQYGSNEIKEIYYTGIANDLYDSNDLDTLGAHKVDSVKDLASNSYINMKEYLLLNNLWNAANQSKSHATSSTDIFINLMKTRDWETYKKNYRPALKFLNSTNLHNVLNGTVKNIDGVAITSQQIIEILNIYYNLNQDVRITINKQMIDMFYLNDLKSYNSIYKNSYLVQAIQQFKPSMVWSIDNSKDNQSTSLESLTASIIKDSTNGKISKAETWNNWFGKKEDTGTTGGTRPHYFNTETITPQFKLSSLGIAPSATSFDNDTNLSLFNKLNNYQGMKYLGDSLADDASTSALFDYTQADQKTDLSQNQLLYTYKTKADGTKDKSTKIYVQGKKKNYHIYYDMKIADLYIDATSGLPFGQYGLSTELQGNKNLKQYIELQLTSKIETDALSLYQTLYYINVKNDDVKKVQPAGTGKDN